MAAKQRPVIRTYVKDGITVEVEAEVNELNRHTYWDYSWMTTTKKGKTMRTGNGSTNWSNVLKAHEKYKDRDFKCVQSAIAGFTF